MSDPKCDWAAGTKVRLTEDDGSVTETTTLSEPWPLGDGTWVVKVAGKSGGYLLDRCEEVVETQGPVTIDLS